MKKELLTPAQVHERYGLTLAALSRWCRMRRLHPLRVPAGHDKEGNRLWSTRFDPADIARAVEASKWDELAPRRHDPMMG